MTPDLRACFCRHTARFARVPSFFHAVGGQGRGTEGSGEVLSTLLVWIPLVVPQAAAVSMVKNRRRSVIGIE